MDPSRLELEEQIRALAPWFHDIEVAPGISTRPGSTYASDRWAILQTLLPASLAGQTCLDIGCSAGYFSSKLLELGAASVLGIDEGEQGNAIEQARFVQRMRRLDRLEYRSLSIYDLLQLERGFDLVLCLGVFYHLRHPMLALDRLRERTRGQLLFQTVTSRQRPRGRDRLLQRPLRSVPSDLQVYSRELDHPSFPRLCFVEQSLAGDASCWFLPNVAAMEAMLRAAGFRILRAVLRPKQSEVFYLCS